MKLEAERMGLVGCEETASSQVWRCVSAVS